MAHLVSSECGAWSRFLHPIMERWTFPESCHGRVTTFGPKRLLQLGSSTAELPEIFAIPSIYFLIYSLRSEPMGLFIGLRR